MNECIGAHFSSLASIPFTLSNAFQDVCEFTHKLLDWLEEAFQIRDVSQKGDVPMKEDPASSKDNAKADEEPMEAENLEKADPEKDSLASVGMEEGHKNAGEKNPMYSLFYGQVHIPSPLIIQQSQ